MPVLEGVWVYLLRPSREERVVTGLTDARLEVAKYLEWGHAGRNTIQDSGYLTFHGQSGPFHVRLRQHRAGRKSGLGVVVYLIAGNLRSREPSDLRIIATAGDIRTVGDAEHECE